MKLIKVYTASGQLDAEMVKTFLESRDIPAVLNQESIGRTLGLSAGFLGEVKVLVPETLVEKAREYLLAMESGEFIDLPSSELPESD